jgi:hypothetical protein
LGTWEAKESECLLARGRISRKGYGILSYIEDTELDQRRRRLPSWVLDWTSHPRAAVAIVDILTDSDYSSPDLLEFFDQTEYDIEGQWIDHSSGKDITSYVMVAQFQGFATRQHEVWITQLCGLCR